MRQILFTNLTVFDGTGALPFAADVRVDGDHIVAVTPPGAAPGEAVVVDGAGGTMLPGLIEPHAHLDFGASVGRIPGNIFALSGKERLLAAIFGARTLLDYGYTSAVSAGSMETHHFAPGEQNSPPNDVFLKAEIDAGRLPGPRLKTCSGQWSPAFAKPELVAPFGYIERSKRAPDAQVARDHVNGVADAGAQIVKIGLNGESGVVPGSTRDLQMHDEEVSAVVETARARNLDVSSHIYSDEAVQQALRLGVRTLYHCAYMEPSTADLIAEQRDQVFVGIGLATLWATMHEAKLPPEVVTKMEAGPTFYATVRTLALLRERGIKVLPGADAGFPFNPIGRNAREFELFVKFAGYNPAEVLALATSGGAALMGQGEELGQIKPGYLADLIIVDGDPISDIALLQDRDRIKLIMKNGELYKSGLAVSEPN